MLPFLGNEVYRDAQVTLIVIFVSVQMSLKPYYKILLVIVIRSNFLFVISVFTFNEIAYDNWISLLDFVTVFPIVFYLCFCFIAAPLLTSLLMSLMTHYGFNII